MAMHTQSTLSPGTSARIAEAATLSLSSFDDESQGLDDEGQGLEDEGPNMEEEDEAALEGQQQTVLVVDIAASEPLGLGYGAARRHALESTEEISPSTHKVGRALVSPSSPIVPSPIASLVATPAATISVDEDQFIEVGAQLELHESILHDHTQRLDALPPTLVTNIDRDEFGARGAITTFGALWMPVLALEAWAGHVNTRLADMSRARNDDHRLIHDMLVQQAAMQHKLQEMRGRVTALEQERGRKEQ
ncbi:hypothetical protein Tco_1083337 [Tanacetum coccineum]